MRVYIYIIINVQTIWKAILEKILKNDHDILVRICSKYSYFGENIEELKKYFNVAYTPMDEIGKIEDVMKCLMV